MGNFELLVSMADLLRLEDSGRLSRLVLGCLIDLSASVLERLMDFLLEGSLVPKAVAGRLPLVAFLPILKYQ